MANIGPDTGSSQFFVLERPAPHLDDRHAVFGRCEPIALIHDWTNLPTDTHDRPLATPHH